MLCSCNSQSGYSYRSAVIRTVSWCDWSTRLPSIVVNSSVHRLVDYRFVEECDFYFNWKSYLRFVRRIHGGTRTGANTIQILNDTKFNKRISNWFRSWTYKLMFKKIILCRKKLIYWFSIYTCSYLIYLTYIFYMFGMMNFF